jgi:hypothetical protein
MSLTKIGGAVGDIKKIGVVNSVADLAGLVGKEDGQQVSVKGYHTGSDVGGGIFYWDSTRTGENDGGTVFDGWVRILAGYVTPEMFGAKGDGVADDTAAIQAALNSAVRRVHFASSADGYRLTATIYAGSKYLSGDSTEPQKGLITRGAGSWLYFDHPSIGLRFGLTDGAIPFTGSVICGLGTRRNQPPTGLGWAPLDHDFDIDIVDSDLTIDDLHLYNATRGIRLRNGSFGRLNCNNVRGFPLKTGIQIYESYDLCRIENLHFWPFYGIQDDGVWSYVINNGVAVHMLRADNPFITNMFSIFYEKAILISAHPTAGTTNKLKVVNADLDRGRFGVFIDSSAIGHVGQYVNISSQGETAGTSANIDGSDGAGLLVAGENCSLHFTNVDFREHRSNAVRVLGSGNFVSIAQLKTDRNDGAGVGFPAIEVLNANTLELLGTPKITNAGPGGKYGATGNIVVDDWREFTPTVSSEIGVITSVSAATAKYKVVGTTVHVEGEVVIGVNGTAAGSVIVNHPFNQAKANSASGSGRERATSGKALTTAVELTSMQLRTYDNQYPAVDGSVLSYYYQYEILNPIP